ncbi:UDP-N-acetylglucosamine transporter [Coprinopsis cinerea okayama7|uniref:UDP-N-acetylglucosamine transporter n=1 Tax=Coprinopsis cinerea (strain Okayama-7 / 130 / ATCC MYA-4618 / FGSC 9003) TaxID=240176 RepID=A8PGS5_COPC7|nr:UDP-N-acetylglucosamine transporter [Coprinopsis cinerea okayama7\|eukprot:XP_001841270.2 UDP-N-acetylglucosamine transporter [Coprinopsis cinerea okayama7\
MLSLLSSWATTLSLVFGGCCANALTLEQLTLTYPNFGSLITFLQFAIISLHGLQRHVTWTRYGPRFKPRRIPLLPYLGQVSLFYILSLLNNAAFAYRIPMPVHIIFRSGGLVVSMLLGIVISKKRCVVKLFYQNACLTVWNPRYNFTQVFAVLLVTAGVILTTLSASQPNKPSTSSAPADPYAYLTGISLLSLALLFGGFLGLLQDWTYTKYGRPAPNPPAPKQKGNGKAQKASSPPVTSTWQESMFYLHFLGLPMFLPLFGDIKQQLSTINYDTPRALFTVPVPFISSLLSFFPSSNGDKTSIPPPYSLPSLDFLVPAVVKNNTFIYPSSTSLSTPDALTLSLPKPYGPLLLNTLTQLLCVAGVNRLTTRVSSLTVTLILVVRKAVSLVISLKGRVIVDWLVKKFGGLHSGPAEAWKGEETR